MNVIARLSSKLVRNVHRLLANSNRHLDAVWQRTRANLVGPGITVSDGVCLLSVPTKTNLDIAHADEFTFPTESLKQAAKDKAKFLLVDDEKGLVTETDTAIEATDDENSIKNINYVLNDKQFQHDSNRDSMVINAVVLAKVLSALSITANMKEARPIRIQLLENALRIEFKDCNDNEGLGLIMSMRS